MVGVRGIENMARDQPSIYGWDGPMPHGKPCMAEYDAYAGITVEAIKEKLNG